MTSKLSIAIGIAPFYSDVRLKRALGISLLPVSFGTADLEADGIDVTYNLALLYKITKNIKFGISYRSGADIEYDGDINFKTAPFLAKIVPEGGVSLDMNLPPIMTTGVSVEINKFCTIEFDLYWQGWSTYDELIPKFDKPVPLLLKKAVGPIIRDYHDILDYCIGLKYQMDPFLTFRLGYFFDNTPAPQKSLDPIIPDADKHTVSFGIGYKNKKYAFDFTYYAIFSKNRKTRNNLDGFNGKYESFSNLISANFIYSF